MGTIRDSKKLRYRRSMRLLFGVIISGARVYALAES